VSGTFRRIAVIFLTALLIGCSNISHKVQEVGSEAAAKALVGVNVAGGAGLAAGVVSPAAGAGDAVAGILAGHSRGGCH